MKAFAWLMVPMLAIAACSRAPQHSEEPAEAAQDAAADASAAPADRAEPPSEVPPDADSGPYLSNQSNPVAAAPAEAVPPPDDPTAPPTPAEAPASTEPAQIYWNTWIEPPCGWRRPIPGLPCPVGTAKRAAKNTLVLSLSLDNLLARFASPAGGGLQRRIEELEGAPFDLAVIPVLTDGSVELAENGERVEYFTFNPAKLMPPRELSADEAANTDPIKLAKRARAASAGKLELPLFFTERAPACTYVTLAIWDGQLRQPIDSLTVPVSVGPEPGDHCADGDADPSVRSGVTSFVSFADVATGEAQATSLSLHSFEFQLKNDMRSFVVVAGHENGKPYVYGWETERPISALLSRTGALPAEIKAARKVLADPKKNTKDRQHAYGKAGAYLRDALFTARPDRDPGIAAAKDALATFKRISSSAAQRLTVHARFTTPGRNGQELFYSPLRLLAAAGADGLAGDIRVIQPLPKRHGTAQTCIDRWTIIAGPNLVTKEEDPDAKDALDAMLAAQRGWVAETISHSTRLSSFFAGEDPPPATAPVAPAEPAEHRAEGLLLLAHHSDDAGFYFDEGQAVMVERAKRSFRPGSVAVLAACATASAGSADGFLKWLNTSRVDGVVASPFLVDASYATLMSHEIFKELDRAYTKGDTPTLAEILQTAVSKVGKPEGTDAADNPLQLEGMEYVVAGNADVRLCRLQLAAQEQTSEEEP